MIVNFPYSFHSLCLSSSIVGGKEQDQGIKDCKKEMDMVNKVIDVMNEGDLWDFSIISKCFKLKGI